MISDSESCKGNVYCKYSVISYMALGLRLLKGVLDFRELLPMTEMMEDPPKLKSSLFPNQL